MSQILDTLGASGPSLASQRLMGVGPMSPGLSLHLISADFNENGFIDEEDLQKIVLRLLRSDDVSEDLLMDVAHHVCIQRVGPEVPGDHTKLQDIRNLLGKGSRVKPRAGSTYSPPLPRQQPPRGWAARGA